MPDFHYLQTHGGGEDATFKFRKYLSMTIFPNPKDSFTE